MNSSKQYFIPHSDVPTISLFCFQMVEQCKGRLSLRAVSQQELPYVERPGGNWDSRKACCLSLRSG